MYCATSFHLCLTRSKELLLICLQDGEDQLLHRLNFDFIFSICLFLYFNIDIDC